jgi:hypothetical protein
VSGVVLRTYLSVVGGVGCSGSVLDPCSLIRKVSKRHIEKGLVLMYRVYEVKHWCCS